MSEERQDAPLGAPRSGERGRALVIFARAPERGRVKTRLARELGDGAALEIYRTVGRAVVDAVRRLPACEVVIAYTPSGGAQRMREWLGPDLRLAAQTEGDLGARIADAMTSRFREGARAVVVIGTDCPAIDAVLVESAFVALDRADVVLGPARDGGYYLVGTHRSIPELFHDVPWSTADTLRATLARARARGLSVALLDVHDDIDTADDWRAWTERAARTSDEVGDVSDRRAGE